MSKHPTPRLAALACLAVGVSTPPGAAAEEASARLEEITVTARKREELLQDTPVSVTALTSEQLETQQIRGLQDLDLGVPNVAIVKNTGTTNAAQIYIRGIGQDESTYHAEQGVGVYLDGVILGKANGALLDLIDFERIEVLRGPQGTLYGRNNTAGAIKFESRRPSLDETRAIADLTVGSYEQLDVRGSLSAPIVEGSLGFKADFVSRSEDGFVKDITRGENVNNLERNTLRLSLLWQPSERTSAYFAADFTRDQSNINLPVPIRTVNGVTTPLYGLYEAGRGIDNIQEFTGYGFVADVSHELDWAQFRSITGWRNFDSDLAGDLDGTATTNVDFEQFLSQEQFTQEFQLLSTGDGPWSYIVGLYAFIEETEQRANNFFQNTRNVNVQDAESYAVYGELSYAITEALKMSVGARYTKDEKTMDAQGFSLATDAPLFDTNRTVDFSDTSPRVVLDWSVSPDVLLYASWSQGYKAGGFANGRPANASQATAVFPSEEVDAYELGMKSEWLDGRLRANLAGFFNDYSNIGFSFLQAGQLSITSADVEIKGAELELTAAPTDGLIVYLNGAWLDGEYTRVPGINPATGTPIAGLTLDKELKHVPEYHYKLGADYGWTVQSGASAGIAFNYNWSAEIWRNLSNALAIQSPDVGFLDAQVHYQTADDRWRFTLAGRNLTDEVYWYQGVNPFSRFYAKPISWSFTVKYQL